MKTKRFLFVSSVLIVAIVCIGIMNIHYDRLSRYPYQDEEARALIDKYFSNQDIEYLIEYSIAPSTFIDYVTYKDFSVYHAEEYNRVRQSIWYLSDAEIVEIVELAREVMSMDELVKKLLEYDSMTVFYYLRGNDQYAEGSELVDNPSSVDAVVDDAHTISSRMLFETAVVDFIPTSKESGVSVSDKVIEPLKAMCAAIQQDLNNEKACGGLVADEGIITYADQKVIYETAKKEFGEDVLLYTEAPGHSEHQLGLALDFSVEGVKQESFESTAQYQWLKENAHRFGFVQSYTSEKEELNGKKERSWHWRYVGNEVAAKMFYENLSLKEAISWE